MNLNFQTDKFCKDCKHFIRGTYGYNICNSPLNGFNPVTGETHTRDAMVNRRLGGCGEKGKWFESSKIVFSTDTPNTPNNLSDYTDNPEQEPKNFFTKLFTGFIKYLYNKFCR